MLCAPKWAPISHELLTNRANGVPKVEVSTLLAPLLTLLGTLEPRGQNQTEMLVVVRSITYLGAK